MTFKEMIKHIKKGKLALSDTAFIKPPDPKLNERTMKIAIDGVVYSFSKEERMATDWRFV